MQLDGERRDECEVPELHSRVNCKAAMSAAELHAILVELEEDNVIMTREGTVYPI